MHIIELSTVTAMIVHSSNSSHSVFNRTTIYALMHSLHILESRFNADKNGLISFVNDQFYNNKITTIKMNLLLLFSIAIIDQVDNNNNNNINEIRNEKLTSTTNGVVKDNTQAHRAGFELLTAIPLKFSI
jgi:hypothetical protein